MGESPSEDGNKTHRSQGILASTFTRGFTRNAGPPVRMWRVDYRQVGQLLSNMGKRQLLNGNSCCSAVGPTGLRDSEFVAMLIREALPSHEKYCWQGGFA